MWVGRHSPGAVPHNPQDVIVCGHRHMKMTGGTARTLLVGCGGPGRTDLHNRQCMESHR